MRLESWGAIKIAFSLNTIELPTVYVVAQIDGTKVRLSFCYDGKDMTLCSDPLAETDDLLLMDDSAFLSLSDIERRIVGMDYLKRACLMAISENRELAHNENWPRVLGVDTFCA